jgi:hypothetical protein
LVSVDVIWPTVLPRTESVCDTAPSDVSRTPVMLVASWLIGGAGSTGSDVSVPIPSTSARWSKPARASA